MKKIFTMIFAALGVIAITFPSTAAQKKEKKNIAYVICAKDGKENEINRNLGKEPIMCVEGHVLTEIRCPKDGVVNKLRNEAGELNTQCSKDGASLIILPQDKGPDKIKEEVLKTYPQVQQERYRIFSKKCSKCHTLARPLNAGFNAREWQKYVKRMMRRPGSEISKSEAKKIYFFLKFYSKNQLKNKK